jgi:hypothetical protein
MIGNLVDGPYGIQEYTVARTIKDLGLSEDDEKLYLSVDVSRLGRPITKVRPTLTRFFRSALDVVEPTIGGSMFMRSPKDLSWLNSRLIHLAKKLSKGDFEGGLIEAEMDNIKKSILLTSAPPGKHIEIAGLKNTSDRYPKAIELLHEYFPVSPRDRLATHVPLTTTRGTNHGWPTYMPGADGRNTVDLLVHLKLATILMDTFKGELPDFETYIRKECGVSEPCSASMFFRKQPFAKWTVDFKLTAQGPKYHGATKGKFCRQRQVYGVPLFINSALRSLANYIRLVYKREKNFDHRGPDDTLNFLLSFKDFVFFSEDLSGYDKSVSVGCQRALALHYYGKVGSKEEMTLYGHLSYLPVLAPPLTSGDSAFLYAREGQTISGSIWTDKDGTLINFARIADCVAAATGWSAGKTRRNFNKSWTALVLGDDCVIGYSSTVDFDRDKYNAKSVELGFKTESFEGAVFLMNYFDLKRRTWYGIAARGLDRTFNKEYDVDDPIVDLFGSYNRLSRLENHPMGPEINEMICSRPAANSAGISNYAELKHLANSKFVLDYLVKYGDAQGKRAKMRDMLAGLTHGTLDIGDISNTTFSLAQLTALEAALVGMTVSDENASAEARMPEDMFKYIRDLSSLELKQK